MEITGIAVGEVHFKKLPVCISSITQRKIYPMKVEKRVK